jgi:chromosome segregation ATPase
MDLAAQMVKALTIHECVSVLVTNQDGLVDASGKIAGRRLSRIREPVWTDFGVNAQPETWYLVYGFLERLMKEMNPEDQKTARVAEAEIARLNSEMKAYQDKFAAELKKSETNEKNAATANSELRKQLEKARVDLEKTEAAEKKAKAAEEAAEKARAGLEKSEKDKEVVKAELSNAYAQMKTSRDERDRLLTIFEQRRAELEVVHTAKDNAIAKATRYSADLAKLKDELENNKVAMQQLEVTNDKLKTLIDDARATEARPKKANDNFKVEIDVQQLTEEICALKERLEQHEVCNETQIKLIAKKDADLLECEEALTMTTNEINNRTSDNSRLELDNATLREKNVNLKTELDGTFTAHKSAIAEGAALKTALIEKDAKLNELFVERQKQNMVSVEYMQTQIAETNAAIEAKQAEFDAAKAEFKAKDAEFDAAIEAKEAAVAELQQLEVSCANTMKKLQQKYDEEQNDSQATIEAANAQLKKIKSHMEEIIQKNHDKPQKLSFALGYVGPNKNENHREYIKGELLPFDL